MKRRSEFHIVEKAGDSALMRPFASKPATIADKDWKKMKATAESVIASDVRSRVRKVR